MNKLSLNYLIKSQLILLITFLSLVSSSSYGQKTALELNLKDGQTYKQVMVSNVTIEQNLNGQEIKYKMGISGDMLYQVDAITEMGFNLKVTYESLSMSINMPLKAIEFSSEKNDDTDIFSMILAEMKGKPFSVLMSKTGKVIEIENIENLFSSAFEKFSDLPEAQLVQIKTQLMNAYGEEAFRGNIEMVTAIFPENTVNQGESWEVNTKLESGMAANMKSIYTFKETSEDGNIISGVSTIVTEDKDAYIESNGMKMKYDLQGNMNSQILVDKQSGWIIKAEINQEIKGDSFIKENPQMPDGMKIPMSMNTKMVITDK